MAAEKERQRLAKLATKAVAEAEEEEMARSVKPAKAKKIKKKEDLGALLAAGVEKQPKTKAQKEAEKKKKAKEAARKKQAEDEAAARAKVPDELAPAPLVPNMNHKSSFFDEEGGDGGAELVVATGIDAAWTRSRCPTAAAAATPTPRSAPLPTWPSRRPTPDHPRGAAGPQAVAVQEQALRAVEEAPGQPPQPAIVIVSADQRKPLQGPSHHAKRSPLVISDATREVPVPPTGGCAVCAINFCLNSPPRCLPRGSASSGPDGRVAVAGILRLSCARALSIALRLYTRASLCGSLFQL